MDGTRRKSRNSVGDGIVREAELNMVADVVVSLLGPIIQHRMWKKC